MRKGEDETYWIGGGTASRCPHGALFKECVVVDCTYNEQYAQKLQSANDAVYEAILALPETLRNKYENYQMDCQCDGYSSIEFSFMELKILKQSNLTI